MAGDQELELRFDVPLYTLAEASRYLVVPPRHPGYVG